MWRLEKSRRPQKNRAFDFSNHVKTKTSFKFDPTCNTTAGKPPVMKRERATDSEERADTFPAYSHEGEKVPPLPRPGACRALFGAEPISNTTLAGVRGRPPRHI